MSKELTRATALIDMTFRLYIDQNINEDHFGNYFNLGQTDKIPEQVLLKYITDYFYSATKHSLPFSYEKKEFKIVKPIKYLDEETGMKWCPICGFETEFKNKDSSEQVYACPNCGECCEIWGPEAY